METKEYGNRRSEEELRKVTDELNALTYVLEDQTDFKGTPEQLKMMQALERYYIDGYPKVSDDEWDTMKRQWNYHESLVSTAPSGRQWVRMEAPLPSIQKAATLDELRSFLSKWPEGTVWTVEPKLDGLTANLVYTQSSDTDSDYHLTYVTSRGNGRYGLRLWEHALDGVKLHGVPQTISMDVIREVYHGKTPEEVEIRGEAMIRKTEEATRHYMSMDNFVLCGAQGNPEAVVWRSVVSGIFNRKVPANLPGLINYLYGKGFDQWLQDVGKHYSDSVSEPVGMSGLWAQVEPIANARMILSLYEGDDLPNRLPRKFKVYVSEDHMVRVEFPTLERVLQFKPYEEEVTVLSYSMAMDGANVDHADALKAIPDLLYVDSIRCGTTPYVYNQQCPVCLETSDIEEILAAVAYFYGCDQHGKRDPSMFRWRNAHEFSLDGVVVKLKGSDGKTQGISIRNALNDPNRLIIPKYPEDQIAIKLQSDVVTVKLKEIVRNTTDLKNVTLQGVLDHPYVTESGAVVQSINLHNPNWLSENPWIKVDVPLQMVMAMDIIPQLLPPEK